MNKEKLDEILETHKAQPVGWGYIDIIVSRASYRSLIVDLLDNGFEITHISWWEWCPGESKAQYGLGGPISLFHEGWFSELPIEDDEIDISQEMEKEKITKKILSTIETKGFKYPKEKIEFAKNTWLTPALWLDVPGDWKNRYYSQKLWK